MAHMNKGTALNRGGQFQAAIDSYRAAIEADPEYEAAVFNLALLLASCRDEQLRDPDLAVRLAEQATETGGGNPLHLNILAEIYAYAGRFDQAAATFRQAIRMAGEAGDEEMLAALAQRLEQLEGDPPPSND
jgi:tetratricopeptide (TPR) repeat protein